MVEILECTIRDGSYAVNFHWKEEEISEIVYELSMAGLNYIEIGNGLGLGYYRKNEKDYLSDQKYVEAAVKSKQDSLIGVFFIPGIGTKEDIKLFADSGGDFIRIGTNVSQSIEACEYIEYAKKLNLKVGFNFMKSYAVTPFELCKRAIDIEKAGADFIYLVDSAGGMLPKQVKHYVSCLRDLLEVKIGFHGHNNLLVANANNLAAIEGGAEFIDTTLLGIGRGAGNSQTETMIVLLKESGYKIDIDPLEVSKISEKYIANKVGQLKGSNGKDLIMGYAHFHDSYLETVEKYAKEFDVDYQKLILEIGKFNKENPSERLICNIAKAMQGKKRVDIPYPKFYHSEIK